MKLRILLLSQFSELLCGQRYFAVQHRFGLSCLAGTLFGNESPRLVEIFGIRIEAELAGHMLYIVNDDKPGFIGRIGTLLGSHGINIGTFNLGRREAGGEAVLLLSLDDALTPAVVAEAEQLDGVKLVKALGF